LATGITAIRPPATGTTRSRRCIAADIPLPEAVTIAAMTPTIDQ
jgi:hypothetical protein